jgi:hypothetical protein
MDRLSSGPTWPFGEIGLTQAWDTRAPANRPGRAENALCEGKQPASDPRTWPSASASLGQTALKARTGGHAARLGGKQQAQVERNSHADEPLPEHIV